MRQNIFFKPTREYFKYQIFNQLDFNSLLSQREIAKKLNIAVSSVNLLIEIYVNGGYVKKNGGSTRDMKYELTLKGKEHIKYLNIKYLSSTQRLYNSAKNQVVEYLNEIITKDKNFNKLIFYGAGEVCELLLNAINYHYDGKIEVVGIIDDSKSKQGLKLAGTFIDGPSILNSREHDGVLITSYSNQGEILNKLEVMGYDKNKILYFFK